MPSVLIVDDHPRFRAAVRRMLASEGWQVTGEAADGRSALAEAARLGPDVVLVDVGLPDLTGMEVARRLRAARPRTRVVLTSTRDAADYHLLAEGCGADGFIAKAELSGQAIIDLLPR